MLGEAREGKALTTTQDDRHLTTGQLHNLRDFDDRTDRIEVFQARVFDTGIALGDDSEASILLLGQAHDLHRLLPADEDGHKGTREDRHIAQSDQRILLGLLFGLEFKLLLFAVSGQDGDR